MAFPITLLEVFQTLFFSLSDGEVLVVEARTVAE